MTFMRTAFVYDVFIYQCYARAFWQGPNRAIAAAPETAACHSFWGEAPRQYHTFPREYPILSLFVFSLPLLTPWLPYNAAFLWWMAVLLIATTGLLAWRGPPRSAVAFALYTLLAGWQFILARYDLVLGLCVLLALILAMRDRQRWATIMLGIGTLLKIFPLLLLPVLLISWRRRDGRWSLDCLGLFVGVLCIGLLPQFLLSQQGFWSPIQYAVQRPLHIESLAGIVLWVTSAAEKGARLVFTYGSYNVVAPHQQAFSVCSTALFIAALSVAYWRQWRGRDSLARSFIVVLLVMLVTNKVFSPQYILWLLPIVAYVEGIRLRWLIVATLIFFVSGDGALPFATTHVTVPTNPHQVLDSLFVLKVLVSDIMLATLVLFYLLRQGDSENGISSR